jgi:tetratricopeptide (TPR) repeat protein
MINLIKINFLMLLTVFLFACAGGEVKQPAASGGVYENKSYVDVDSDVNTDFNKAVELLRKEQYQQAITVLESVIEREQRLPAPYVNIAMAYNKLGDTAKAEENFISALKLDIGHPTANNELGLLYRKAGRFNAARVAYQNAIKEHSDYLPAKRNLGVLCDLYLHDYKCALEQYEDYLELQPEDKTVAIWVSDVKQRIGN